MRLDHAARRYLGTPFLHQGRDPTRGIDCIGLLVAAAKDCGLHGLAAHDFTGYARNPAAQVLESRLSAALSSADDLQPGYIVSVDFFGKTRHVGIIGEHCGRLTIIHTYNRPSKVIEHGIDEKWLRRIKGIYRVEAAA